jgi:O-methyltransferase
MSNRTIGLDDRLHRYLLNASLREHPLLTELRDRTAAMPEANYQIAPEQGQFMAFLAQCIGARRYLEIGTFTGYSALAIALAMPEDGEVTACDLSREWTDVARTFWQRAGVENRIRLELGPARDTLAIFAPAERTEALTWPSSMPTRPGMASTTSNASRCCAPAAS